MLITVNQAREYARDYESSDATIKGFIKTAESYIASGVGPVGKSDPEAQLLCGLIVCEIDDCRQMSAAEANSTRLLVTSLKHHLRLKNKAVSNSDTATEKEPTA